MPNSESGEFECEIVGPTLTGTPPHPTKAAVAPLGNKGEVSLFQRVELNREEAIMLLEGIAPGELDSGVFSAEWAAFASVSLHEVQRVHIPSYPSISGLPHSESYLPQMHESGGVSHEALSEIRRGVAESLAEPSIEEPITVETFENQMVELYYGDDFDTLVDTTIEDGELPPTLEEPPVPVHFVAEELISEVKQGRPTLAKLRNLKGWKINQTDRAKGVSLKMGIHPDFYLFMEGVFENHLVEFKQIIRDSASAKEITDRLMAYAEGQEDLKNYLFIFNDGQPEEDGADSVESGSKAFLKDCMQAYRYGGEIVLKDFLRHPSTIISTETATVVYNHDGEVRKVLGKDLQHLLEDQDRSNAVKRVLEEADHNARREGADVAEKLITLEGMIIGSTSEYIPGDKMFREALLEAESVADKVHLFKCLLFQLYYEMHSRGFVHRDLKFGNVKIHGDKGVPWLLDFGVSRKFERDEPLTSPDAGPIGTPQTMAPEQLHALLAHASLPMQSDDIEEAEKSGYRYRGPLSLSEIEEIRTSDTRICSASMDVYAIGVMLYQVFARRLPFPRSKSVNQLMLNRIYFEPPSIPGISSELEAIIMKCLSLNPKDRYQDARELLTALNKLNPHE